MKILVINAGSSSLKFQLIDMENEAVIAKGICEEIGGNANASCRINIDKDKDFHGMKGHFVLDFDDMSPEEQEKYRKIKEKAEEISQNAENISKNALNFTKRILDSIGKAFSEEDSE